MRSLDSPTEVSLENMRVHSVEDLPAPGTPEIARRLGNALLPVSEKLIGAPARRVSRSAESS